MASKTNPTEPVAIDPTPTEVVVTASTPNQMDTFLNEGVAHESFGEAEIKSVQPDASMVINTSVVKTTIAVLETELHPGLVAIKASDDAKYMEPGKVYPVSPETAEIIEKSGQGKLV